MTFHATRKAALASLASRGFEYQRAEIMGEGVWRNPEGNRAWIEGAGYRSFDRAGKHWFMVKVMVA